MWQAVPHVFVPEWRSAQRKTFKASFYAQTPMAPSYTFGTLRKLKLREATPVAPILMVSFRLF